MKSKVAVFLIPIVLLCSSVAEAHFKLEQPVDALETDATGDPKGGDQKTEPCGTGTSPSPIVKQVRAGGKLHVKIIETVPHGGHYRIAISNNRASFVDPVPVVQSNDCKSAPIQANPVAPVVADGLFKHTQAEAVKDKVYETDITVPSTTCADCTLQIIEFMTPHPPGCFYYHCAKIEIVDANAELPDASIDIDTDAGKTGSDAGKSDGGSKNKSTPAEPTENEGCNVGGGGTPSLLTLGIFGVIAGAMFRGRRRNARRSTRRAP